MAYQVLYRKYRPQKFSDLTGQETTLKILQSALIQNRIASAYLFSGPRGTGKTTTARIFAKALNCKNRPELGVMGHGSEKLTTQDSRRTTKFCEPCNACASCQEIVQGSSLDVLELDAASHTQVDKIREVIIDTVAFAPVRDRYKIFIIDEVHMLSNHSFNALLKTLEEPPTHVIFMLCTTEFHKIPATIASRCQRYRFLPMTQKQLTDALKKVAENEKINIEIDALSQIARAASGSVRDALSLLDQIISNLLQQGETKEKKIELSLVQETLGIVREELIRDFILKIAQSDAKGVLNCIEQVSCEGLDLSYFLKELRESFRQMLLAKCGAGQEEIGGYRKLPVEQMNLHQILRSIQLLNKCADQMRWSDFPRLVFECYAVWLCQPAVEVGEFLKRIEGGKETKSDFLGPPKEKNFFVEPESGGNLLSSNPAREESALSTPLSVRELHPQPARGVVSLQQASSVKTESNLEPETWKAVLSSIQQTKPSLFHPLQTARVAFAEEKIQLSFGKLFWLENVKRNKFFIEETFAKVMNRKLPVEFVFSPEAVVVEEKFPLLTADADEEVQSSLVPNTAEQENGSEEDLFEVVESTALVAEPSAKSVEDEGIKNFLQFFPGKLAPLPTKPQG